MIKRKAVKKTAQSLIALQLFNTAFYILQKVHKYAEHRKYSFT